MTNTCWILSSARTGGNYLSHLLNATGLFPPPAFGEWFGKKSDRDAFLRTPPNNINLHYVPFIEQFGRPNASPAFLKPLVPSAKFLLLRRHDVLAQTASFYIATETKTWKLLSDHARRDFEAKRIAINDRRLMECYHITVGHNPTWPKFESDPDTLVLDYELLDASPAAVLTLALRFCGLPTDTVPAAVETGSKTIQRMSRPETPAIIARLKHLLG